MVLAKMFIVEAMKTASQSAY